MKTIFTFTVLYDTTPDIVPADVSALTLSTPTVVINEEDIDKELKGIQERNAITSDKTTAIENNDIVTMSFVELDDNGNEIAGTKRESFTATIGSKQTLYDIDDDILELVTGDEKIIKKDFPKDYQFSELAAKSITLKIVVTAVKQKDLPDIDDELAQDVNEKYKTLAELKADLKVQLQDRASFIIEKMHRKKIVDFLLEKSSIQIPESAVKLQLENFWNRFVQSNGGNTKVIEDSLIQMGQTKEQLTDTWKEDAKKQVAEQLVLDSLIKKENINIADDDVFATLKEDCEKTGNNFEEVKEYYTKHQLIPQLKYDIAQKKLFEILKNRTKIETDKEKSFSQLVEEQDA